MKALDESCEVVNAADAFNLIALTASAGCPFSRSERRPESRRPGLAHWFPEDHESVQWQGTAMLIPNADRAVIAPEKLRDYLLNAAHRRGAAKARLLTICGYSPDAWQVLEADLRAWHLTAEVAQIKDNPYGRRYEIRAPLLTPSGRRVVFESVWQVDNGTDVPRLITMYPR